MYINERTNCSWQKHAIPKRTASGTLIHCEATNPVPQHRQGPVELEQVRRTKRRVAKDLFRIHQVTTKVAGFQHISMANQLFSICFNGISLKIELLRLLVHRTFYSLVFWYTNNLQYEILISHGKKHLWFWDIMGERLEYSIPIPLFLEIPNPPKTQRVFWVNPSFSYSTLRKTNICMNISSGETTGETTGICEIWFHHPYFQKNPVQAPFVHGILHQFSSEAFLCFSSQKSQICSTILPLDFVGANQVFSIILPIFLGLSQFFHHFSMDFLDKNGLSMDVLLGKPGFNWFNHHPIDPWHRGAWCPTSSSNRAPLWAPAARSEPSAGPSRPSPWRRWFFTNKPWEFWRKSMGFSMGFVDAWENVQWWGKNHGMNGMNGMGLRMVNGFKKVMMMVDGWRFFF